MRLFTITIIAGVLWLTPGLNPATAQSTGSKVSQPTLLSQGDLAYRDLKFSQAASYYESYLKNHSGGDSEAVRVKLADCYWQMRNYPQALRVYKQLYPNGKGTSSEKEQFRIGELYARSGDYGKAAQWLEPISGYQGKAACYSPTILQGMRQDSAAWKLGYLNLNTRYREFSPLLKDSVLLFSSNRPLTSKKKAFGWDGEYYSRLWKSPLSSLKTQGIAPPPSQVLAAAKKDKAVSKRNLAGIYEGSDTKATDRTKSKLTDNVYVKASQEYIGTPVEGLSELNYNAGGISIDKENDIYFSSNYPKADKKGVNRIRLMQGHYNGSTIDNIQGLPFGDFNSYSVMHPAVNPEGTILVFSSDKQGGQGQWDLYYSKRASKKDSWTTPFPLPGTINTSGNEVFPSITSDGYLYYSSDGKAGLGGLDMYKIKLEDALAGTGAVEHLTYPLNSSSDDFGWTQSQDGKAIYFTSDRVSSEDNIYTAQYDTATARKAQLAREPRKLEGFVLDRQTMEPLKGATVFLRSDCDKKVYVTKTNEKGKYSYPVTASCQVVLLGADKGFSKDCLGMKTKFDQTSQELVQKAPHDLLLDKYTQDFKWKLSYIHYDFDKWAIRPDARPILDSLVDILKTYPIKVELGSHTDCRGSFAYNDRLSQRRAESAVAYIVSKGIDPSRITAKGYGEHQLLNKCADGVPCSEAAHQANRRTEIKVLIGQPSDQPEGFDPSRYKEGEVLDPDQLPAGFFDNCK